MVGYLGVEPQEDEDFEKTISNEFLFNNMKNKAPQWFRFLLIKEELSELILAISHYERNGLGNPPRQKLLNDFENLAEEISHVKIYIEYLEFLYHNEVNEEYLKIRSKLIDLYVKNNYEFNQENKI